MSGAQDRRQHSAPQALPEPLGICPMDVSQKKSRKHWLVCNCSATTEATEKSQIPGVAPGDPSICIGPGHLRRTARRPVEHVCTALTSDKARAASEGLLVGVGWGLGLGPNAMFSHILPGSPLSSPNPHPIQAGKLRCLWTPPVIPQVCHPHEDLW